MARWIDRTAVSAGMAALYYLFFLSAWRSIPLACGAAFVCCVLTRRLARGLPHRRRASRSQAQTELLRIASLPDDEATAALEVLARRRCPDEAFALSAIVKHPEASLSCGDVLTAWKAHRQAERLLIAATCPCEARALAYARELRQPRTAVLDRHELEKLLRSDDALRDPAPSPRPRDRLRRFAAVVGSARVSPRNVPVALALLALYLLRGNILNLFASLLLLAHFGVALAQRRVGRRLFD